MNKRRKFSSAFKTKVVLEALSERQTIQELARKYEIHPAQITQWKSHFLANAESVFDNGSGKAAEDDHKAREERLLKIIGEQKVDIDFLKKALS